jgi:hypothetical protein
MPSIVTPNPSEISVGERLSRAKALFGHEGSPWELGSAGAERLRARPLRQVSGDGTVYTYTVVRHPTHFAFADKLPYVLAIVELAEGPRLVTALTSIEPGEVRVSLPVRAMFREVAGGVTLPYFEPATTRSLRRVSRN